MKSVRLTKESRKAVKINLCNRFEANYFNAKGYNSYQDYYTKRYNHLVTLMSDLWLRCFGDDIAKKLDELPREFVSCKTFTVACEESPRFLYRITIPGRPGKNTVDLSLPEKEFRECFGTYVDMERVCNNYAEAKNAFQSEVETLLSSVNTTAQLVEVWPEVEEFLPQFLVEPSKSLVLTTPGTSVEELNKKLKL